MKKIKKAVYVSLAVLAAAVLCSCGKTDSKDAETTASANAGLSEAATTVDQSESAPAVGQSETASDEQSAAAEPDRISTTATIHKDAKFDSADLDMDAEDFTEAGFSLGDSLDVTFSNGITLTDIPYFNGYYVKTGNPAVVAYPKNDYVLIANANADFWTPSGLEDGMTVTITLNESAKYLATQEALGQSYSVDRADFASDIIFANFREVKGGSIKPGFLYRGVSPVDNSRNRASYANALIEEHNIACVLDLADTDEKMLSYFEKDDFNSDYAKKLYNEGRTATLSMTASYSTDKYKQSVVKGLRKLIEVGGPAYIHCLEGKDRTGFVCVLIEALAGASYDEMCDDYMITYDNYYGISKEATPERYDAVVSLYFDAFMEYLSGEENTEKLQDLSYVNGAKQYLIDGGMTETEIDELLELITDAAQS